MSNEASTPCYLYIPFTGQEGDWSEWDLWMTETFVKPSAKQAFMGWVGALLDAKNTGKQALWLHGRGNDGKTQIGKCLCEFFGPAAVALNGFSMKTQFGAAKLENKRLVVFSDAKNQKLLQTEWAHLLTGSDQTDVERKGKNSYSATLSGKLMVMCNFPAEIKTDETNQTVRLLYIRCRKRSDEEALAKGLAVRNDDGDVVFVGSSEWIHRLRAQMPAFFNACFEVYQDVAPTRSNIVISRELRVDMESMCADPVSENIAAICDRVFERSNDPSEFLKRTDAISALRAIENEFGLKVNHTFTLSEINSYLYNAFGAEKVKGKVGDGKRETYYTNIKLREIEQDSGL
jgi:hypothetical protein